MYKVCMFVLQVFPELSGEVKEKFQDKPTVF